VPTNEQRRETAKQKLEQQLERRARQARRNRILTVVVSVAVVAAVAAIVTVVLSDRDGGSTAASSATSAPQTAAAPRGGPGQLPVFKPPADLGADCQYPPATQKAAKQVAAPNSGRVPTEPATVSVSMATDQGNIGLMLNNAEAPCTVNSFVSLAQKGFFKDTPCHRLTTAPTLGVLQCGDPGGTGGGGPGYRFADEYPTNQYPANDPALEDPVLYPRGTLAMANAGPQTNGSQFFLVYKDSRLAPNYTVFGTIDATGLATLDKIAQAGVVGGGEDGKPATAVTITSVLLD